MKPLHEMCKENLQTGDTGDITKAQPMGSKISGSLLVQWFLRCLLVSEAKQRCQPRQRASLLKEFVLHEV